MDEERGRGGILIYVKSSLPSEHLTNFKLPDEVQIIEPPMLPLESLIIQSSSP